MDPIDREAFLADLFCPANLQQQRQAPTSASSARNTSSNSNPLQANLESPSTVTTSRPHASASASPSVAAPHFWDVEALNKMMRSNPPEGAVHDLSLATSNRSKAPSPPAIPNLRGSSDSSYFNYFGTFTAATNHALTQEPASSSAPTTCSSPVLQAPALELLLLEYG
ncbi:hypothetical protein BGZ47_009099 [Haplosporangium gracile]|nr:hypothetical protein BGZ47_009099 [Haplosporangium gracile]